MVPWGGEDLGSRPCLLPRCRVMGEGEGGKAAVAVPPTAVPPAYSAAASQSSGRPNPRGPNQDPQEVSEAECDRDILPPPRRYSDAKFKSRVLDYSIAVWESGHRGSAAAPQCQNYGSVATGVWTMCDVWPGLKVCCNLLKFLHVHFNKTLVAVVFKREITSKVLWRLHECCIL